MRGVYRPPSTRVSWVLMVLGACLGTLCVFLVLPLTQVVSSGLGGGLELVSVDSVGLPPPPPVVVELEEELPPEREEVEEAPELVESVLGLSLGDLDLDVGVGMGGVLGGGLGLGGGGVLEGGAVFDVADLDERPVAVSQVSPRYPAGLLREGVEGSVVLLFVLGLDGGVEDVRVESSSRSEFEGAAVEAVRRWRFRPGRRGGEVVRSFVRLTVPFRLAR